MKIVAISDIHGNLIDIPECDILLISGDISKLDIQRDNFLMQKWLIGEFSDWLKRIPAKHIVFTPGNHDFIFETDMVPKFPENAHCVIDKQITIEGIKIYCSPWQNWWYDWCFNAPPNSEGGEEFLAKKYSQIPEDTDIIVSHGPPNGYGDHAGFTKRDRTGSKALTKRIWELPNIKFVICGHIHEDYGKFELGNVIIFNASILNREYEIVNPPIEIMI